jgi:hypothetical protein
MYNSTDHPNRQWPWTGQSEDVIQDNSFAKAASSLSDTPGSIRGNHQQPQGNHASAGLLSAICCSPVHDILGAAPE